MIGTQLLDQAAAAWRPARWTRDRFAQAGASVGLTTDSTTARAAALDLLYAYHREPGLAACEVAVWTAPPVTLTPTDLAGAAVIEVGPRLHAHVLRVELGEAFWIPQHRTLIHTDPRRRRITAYCGSAHATVYWAPRLVRQAMSGQLLAAGAVYVHAAACALGERGVLVAGAKGAGKTTVLLAALQLLGADLVTNDRLLVRADRDGTLGVPWPAHLLAGTGTLRSLPGLAWLAPADGEHHRTGAKVAIEPRHFPLLHRGGTVRDHVRPDLMLWPRRDTTAALPPRRVPPGEVLATLRATRAFMIDTDSGRSSHVNHWLIPPPAHTEHARGQVLRALAAIPCYHVAVGDDPHALAQQIRSTAGAPR